MSETDLLKIGFNRIPGTSKLFRDYLYNYSKVEKYYNLDPYNEESYFHLFSDLEKRTYSRDSIVEVLKEQNRKFGASNITVASIDRLRNNDTFVIFTGQQVGLFGGPMYTLHKAMTAVNLARYLTMTTQYTFLPLFWVEGEDHDFEEIRHTSFINKDNSIQKLFYNPAVPFGGQCVGDMVLDDTINDIITEFIQGTHPGDYRDQTLEALRECYRPGATLAEAFARWIARLLGPYGLIMVDPSDARLKEIARPVFLTSLEKHGDSISSSLQETGRQLESDGYHVQVHHNTDTTDFFYHEPRRLSFIVDGDTYRLKNTSESYSYEDLKKLITENPENFSPNVILRPLMQDHVFPTAAYVAGPSEIAYFAQFKGLYEIFQIPMPVIYPRKSLTIVEKRIDKILDKYNLNFEDLFTDYTRLEKRVLKSSLPQELNRALEDMRNTLSDKMEILENEAFRFNRNLKPVIRNMQGNIQKEIAHGVNKITRAVEKNDRIVGDQLEKAYVNLFPGGGLQERRLNILTYLYKYHNRLIYSLMELTCCRHENRHIVWRVDL